MRSDAALVYIACPYTCVLAVRHRRHVELTVHRVRHEAGDNNCRPSTQMGERG